MQEIGRSSISKGYFRVMIHLLIDIIGTLVIFCICGLLLFFISGIIIVFIDEVIRH